MKTQLDDLDVQRLRLEPGDVVVVFAPRPLTIDQVDRVTEVLKPLLPAETKCVVLDSGLKLAVLSAAEAAAIGV